MEVEEKYMESIIPDNDLLYINLLKGLIESIDELSSLQITKLNNHYHFRIASSLPKYNNMLLQEILKLNNMFGIKLNISKSIKSTASLAFSIPVS